MLHPYSVTELTSLILQTSMEDCIADYKRSLSSAAFPHWDAVILTASDESQAEGFRNQIQNRKAAKKLPPDTEFIVVPDRGNRRVGSGGSTLSVIRELKRRYGDFSGNRYLCIHAGGNSSRCPQYSALGKLFSSIPSTVDGCPATIFDLTLVIMSSMAGRIREGMLILSGDVILLFNPLMCDFGNAPAAVISFKESVETGKDHGVYVGDSSGNVSRFLHKQSVERLRQAGAADDRDMCSVDTGALWLGAELLDRLHGLVDTDAKFDGMVNDRVRLSLYGDIAYCLAGESTLEQLQKEAPEGSFCDELKGARELLWNAVGSYTMKLNNISPARFVHFGSVPEIMTLMNSGVKEYENIGWSKQIYSLAADSVAAYLSVLSDRASVGGGCFLEASIVHAGAALGNNVYLSYVDVQDEQIPDNVLLHGLKQKNGKFVCRIMDIRDNPKQSQLFGREINDFLTSAGVLPQEIWEESGQCSLWTAKLYPECADIRGAVESALNLYRLVTGQGGDLGVWRGADRKSLESGFQDADPQAIIDWRDRMEDLVRMHKLKELIQSGQPVTEAGGILQADKLTKIQLEWLQHELQSLDMSELKDFGYAVRLHYYLGIGLRDENRIGECFALIADTVLGSAEKHLRYNETAHISMPETVVRLPLRVNWGGGWSDTCPHCLEHGGTVLNAAISLNGELPVEVRLKKIPEEKIVFDSRDMDVHGEFDDIVPLQKLGDPYDPFVLQKACLIACGIIPRQGGSLERILERLGGGFEMHSEVTNVPKGSGLGTSSILSAAAVKAVLEFTGSKPSDEVLYATVLAMEQMMSTGGGWQDQVGGITPGVKFITSNPGIEQAIKVEQVVISEETRKELTERFALIYTGQKRLARHLLRDVVGRYVGNMPESLYAHKEIQRTSALMRLALQRGDVNGFAVLLDEHWGLSRKIDEGSTDSLIDQIFMVVDDMIDARMVCGAGGGGFLQVILKKGVTKDDVHRRLKDVFQDFAVDVWQSEFVF